MPLFSRRRRVEAAAPAGIISGTLSPFADSPGLLGQLLAAELYGGADLDTLPLDRAAAMAIPAAAKARNAICTTVARQPLQGMRGSAPIRVPLLDQPEPGRPRFVTMTWVTDALLWYGRAWLVVRSRYAEDGRPRELEWIPEWQATLDERSQLTAVRGLPVSPRDVIRIDGPHEGVLNFGTPALRFAQRLDRAALRVADNPVPAIELHQTTPNTLTADERAQLVQEWIAARKRHGVGYTSSAIEARVHGSAAEHLLIEGRKAAALDVARTMGVPAWVVDGEVSGSSLTYSNTPSRSRELLDYGVAGYMEAIVGRLSLDDVLPRGEWARFDSTALLRADFPLRMTAYRDARDSGVYTVPELRAMEDGIPVEPTAPEGETA